MSVAIDVDIKKNLDHVIKNAMIKVALCAEETKETRYIADVVNRCLYVIQLKIKTRSYSYPPTPQNKGSFLALALHFENRL